MRLKFYLLLFVVVCLPGKAQQAAYFVLGEDQFKSVQVYDIIQDKELNYWFATNEGLFYFDHYTYRKIECDKAKSNSFFNFVMDGEGTIYCHNLNNQVFRIRNKSSILFYELKAGEISPDISLSITRENNLLIGAKKIIHLSPNGDLLNHFTASNYYIGPPFNPSGQYTIYHLGGSDSVIIVSGNKAHTQHLTIRTLALQKGGVLKFFQAGAAFYAINLKTKDLYSFNPQNFELSAIPGNPAFERSESMRLYITKNHIWVAGTLPGAVQLDTNLKPVPPGLCYGDYFISDVFEDKEGNVLMATFDKGVLVIPDLEIPGVIHSFKEDPITALAYERRYGLLLGSSKGLLFSSDGKTLTTIDDKGKRPIETLYANDSLPWVIFDNGHIRAYNKQTKSITGLYEGSLKDVVMADKNLFYLGTNRGIVKCRWSEANSFNCDLIPDFNFRIYSMTFNPRDQVLYASTSNGLFAIKTNHSKKEILFHNEPVFPNSLACYNGLIYAADKRGAVLVIEKDSVKKSIPLKLNDEPEAFGKIVVHNNTIIARSLKGLFQFDLDGTLVNALSVSRGFSANRVINFTVYENTVWVSHTNGVQPINLDAKRKKNSAPLLYLNRITVNDTVQLPGKTEYLNAQRKFQFTLSVPGLQNRESIRYHWKLEGNDKQWSITDFTSNQVTYNALAPGNYTFYAKAEKQGQFSNTISYSFSIASPLFTRWWFITIAVVLFLILVYIIYSWQLDTQRKKSRRINELNASKLTAIQSQMNPHFIFNSLNSIQDLILKGDVENSYSYITTFSNLVRKTLSYSGKDFIDFEQEINLLEIYLSLEQLRFKKNFTFTLEANEITGVQIPPLLVQPFVENALVHGLLHKEGIKKLSVKFELKDTLICTIEDNGVGREKARAIRQRQRSDHESFSAGAIRKRFEIFSEAFKGQFGFSYEDLSNNGEAAGTRVTLSIPVKHNY